MRQFHTPISAHNYISSALHALMGSGSSTGFPSHCRHRYDTIADMKARHLHPWDISPSQAVDIQRRLANRVEIRPLNKAPTFVAGLDISGVDSDGCATAAVVVLSYPYLEIIECRVASSEVPFPYIPGLLSFRETPTLSPVLESLSVQPDILLIDGQGIAHPRRFGIACHLGLLFDIPTIGCAKSRLIGAFDEPALSKGSHTFLWDEDEVIGAAFRSRDGTRPIFISVGHKVDLVSALRIVRSCSLKYRIPEPTRLAHLAAAGKIAPFVPEF